MRDARLANYLHLHFIVFIWGFTAVLGALISIDSIPLVWYRMGMAVVFLAIYMLVAGIGFRGRPGFSLSRKLLLKLLLAGVIIALHWVTFFMSVKVSTVSVCLAMMSTGAFFTAILEPLFTKRKFIGYELIFGLIIIGALYYIFQVESEYLLGMALGLVSALLSAVFSIMNVQFVKVQRPSLISFYELVAGVAFLSLTFLVLPVDFVPPSQLTQMDWIWMVILAAVCTTYAFIASIKVMRTLSAYTVMLTINLEPVYGILLAFAILGTDQQMTPEFYAGAAVILAVILTNGIIKTRMRKKEAGQ